MPVDDLFQALGMLQKGVQQYQTIRSISQANDMVNQIKGSALKDEQKMSEIRNVANGLAMHMVGLGVPTDQINTAFQSVTGDKQNIQTPEQAILTGSQSQRQLGYQLFNAELGNKIKQVEAMSGAKTGKEQRQALMSYQKQFAKSDAAIAKSRQQAEGAINLLNSGNKLTPTAIQTLMARASGEVGNLTEAERSAFAGSQDVISRIKRWADLKGNSELPEADKKALKDLAQNYLNISNQANQENATMFTNQALGHPLLMAEDPNQLVRAISGGKVKQYQDFGSPAVSTPQQQPQAGTPTPSGVPAQNPLSAFITPLSRK